jgi:sulfite dehydrogenase (quinone) subunit SoeC
MKPAFSVIFLTTLLGASQGLFLLLAIAEWSGHPAATQSFLVVGGGLCVVLAGLGLVASFFHLGHPERAWRAATMWRTSWLSREVIALPVYMGLCALWSLAHAMHWAGTGVIAIGAALSCAALFVCTAMVYASVRFLREWSSPFTLVNYVLLGCASGATLAAGLAALLAPALAAPMAMAALALTLAGGLSRSLSLRRNARLKPKSTLQSAIGVHHPRITQRAQGFMGGSFNTREFFHGRSPAFLRAIKWWFLALAFVVPALMLAIVPAVAPWLLLCFAVQYLGLLIERWFFLAQANHPQNLYYQNIS